MDCIRCKGRVDSKFACGRDFCPVYARSEAMFKSVDNILKDEFSGTAPTVFVGHYSYPKVNVGILSSSEPVAESHVLDAPSHWANNSFPIKRIVEIRSGLVNSRFSAEVKVFSKGVEQVQEIAMSSKPVDVDIKLFKKPEPKIVFSGVSLPMGPSAPLKKADLATNPKVSSKVEKVFGDDSLKSSDAMKFLYSKGASENDLSRMLSVGVFGVKRQRKLVPTRWSITATDDLLAKFLMRDLKSYSVADYQMFYGNLYGNHYFIMLLPEAWSYELFEGYMPMSLWNSANDISFATDYEPYGGRKSYAENTAGGYYAARLPIVEKLSRMRRQASVLVLRFITDEYSCPLGVFVCREAVRKSLSNPPIVFSSREEMLGYAKSLVKQRFNFDLGGVLSQSVILRSVKAQTKLSSFSPEPHPD